MIGCGRSTVITPYPSSTDSPIKKSSTIQPSPSSKPPPTIPPSPEETTNRLPAMPGLIYCSDDGLWATRPDGNFMFLVPDCRAYFSPNYQYALFDGVEDHYVLDLHTGKAITELNLWDTQADPNMEYAERLYGATWSKDSKSIFYESGPYSEWFTDIWSFDIHTGSKINLSNTEDRFEGWPRLFGDDNKLLFSSQHDGDEFTPYFSGYLTSMNLDGSEYLVYSEEKDNGNFRISPDGSTAAIFGGELFTQDYAIQRLSPRIINADQGLEYQLYYPSWSFGGKYIGWGAGIDTDQAWLNGIGIHNLEDNSFRLLYPYIMVDGEGFPSAPDWSPDNNWVSFRALNPDNRNGGLFIIKLDGSEEYFFEGFDNAVWGSVTDWIILNTGDVYGGTVRGVWIININDWKPVEIDLPKDAVVIDWIDPDIVQNWIGFDS